MIMASVRGISMVGALARRVGVELLKSKLIDLSQQRLRQCDEVSSRYNTNASRPTVVVAPAPVNICPASIYCIATD